MIELGKSKLAFGVDRDLRFDPAFLANKRFLRSALEDFQPDIVHVTSPGDCGILGAILAHELRLPLAASWHTNLHEFAGRRLERLLSWIPLPLRTGAANSAERATLRCVLRFYQLAKVLFAPNRELVELLEGSTGRPVFLMRRGVDTTLYNPRARQRDDQDFVIGYAGRLTPEKNVGLLSSIEQALIASGVSNYRFEIAGHGSELERLRARLRRAVFHGVLKGERLARAYANMDIFAFPSRTDTYGNVVQEALASGVPAVVTNGGGPKYLVGHGVTGLVTGSDQEFIAAVVELAKNPHLHSRLRHSTLVSVKSLSWDAIFEDVYAGYDAHFRGAGPVAGVAPAVAALNCGA
jgi:glycosyltransferase involved in cell wall biosynthesis